MAKTEISWAEHSYNPIRAKDEHDVVGWHCEKISPGCKNCYAKGTNDRFGTGLNYAVDQRPKISTFISESALVAPLRRKKPTRYFVCSMTDLFGDFHPDWMIDVVFAVATLCPQHTFIVLTKRATRALEYMSEPGRGGEVAAAASREAFDEWSLTARKGKLPGTCSISNDAEGALVKVSARWPLPNVWLGVSVENQQYADERIPLLIQMPAAVRWISAEPLLGSITFRPKCDSLEDKIHAMEHGYASKPVELIGLNWVVVGGESGPDARPCNVDWIRSIVSQCQEMRVPVFVKQLGTVPMESEEAWRGRVATRLLSASNRDRVPEGFVPLKFGDRKGGEMDEFPVDLRVREYPI